MKIYALCTSKARTPELESALPCDGGSLGVNSTMMLFGSSLTHSDLGTWITQNIRSVCPALLVPLSRGDGHVLCAGEAAHKWLEEHLPKI